MRILQNKNKKKEKRGAIFLESGMPRSDLVPIHPKLV